MAGILELLDGCNRPDMAKTRLSRAKTQLQKKGFREESADDRTSENVGSFPAAD